VFTGVAVTVLVGTLLLAGAVVEIVFAFKAESFEKSVVKFLFGGLGVLAGVVIIATPMESMGLLMIVLSAFFLAGGIVEVILSLKLRPEGGWGWLLFSGIASIALGALIALKWPLSGVWAVGLYVGVRMAMHGWVLATLGGTGQEVLTRHQDPRIEMLEHHVRAGARALQETQAALAEHAAMFLALDNDLRKKLSSDEIGPTIRELNRKLGEAREQMRAVSSATGESWNKKQNEANAVFGKLQKGAAEITKGLKQSLGLDKHSQPRGGLTH
jgi:uncharacterized membrane protein HdeD (DUF308 family)